MRPPARARAVDGGRGHRLPRRQLFLAQGDFRLIPEFDPFVVDRHRARGGRRPQAACPV